MPIEKLKVWLGLKSWIVLYVDTALIHVLIMFFQILSSNFTTRKISIKTRKKLKLSHGNFEANHVLDRNCLDLTSSYCFDTNLFPASQKFILGNFVSVINHNWCYDAIIVIAGEVIDKHFRNLKYCNYFAVYFDSVCFPEAEVW